MKIDAALFKTFVTKATLNAVLGSMVIKIDETGMTAQQKDLSNTAMSSIRLLPDKIKEKEPTILCIKNTNMLIKSLSSFSGEIEVKKAENVLSLFNGDRQIDIILSSEEFIECNMPAIPESLKTAFDGGVNLNVKPFKDIVNDMGIVNGKNIIVTVKDKKLELTTGDKGFDKISVKAPADYSDATAKYGELFANVINVLDDKINVALKQDFPIQITETVDGMSCKYIVAPLVEQD